MKYLLILCILLIPSLALADDIYVAQTTSGFGFGTNCGDARPIGFFNTLGNWGVGASDKISAGDTVHLCGTFTSNLTAQASGSLGNPITIVFETDAKIRYDSPGFCPGGTSGCFSMRSKSYIILDGGTNGIIENPSNGTASAGYVTQQSDTVGVQAGLCTNCEIKNITIQGMYVHTNDPSDVADDYGLTNAVLITGSHNRVHHLTIHDTGWAIKDLWLNGDNDVEFDHNTISRSAHVFVVAGPAGAVGANSSSNYRIHDNTITEFTNWDTTINKYHQNGLHLFSTPVAIPGKPNAQLDDVNFYNNYYESLCSPNNMTAFAYAEGPKPAAAIITSDWTVTGTLRVYNNIFRCTSATTAPLVSTSGGHIEIYNNTFLHHGYPAGTGLSGGCLATGNTTNLTVRNNVMTGCDIYLFVNDTVSTSTLKFPSSTYFNKNTYGSCKANAQCFTWPPLVTSKTFSAWKGLCDCDAGSSQSANLSFDSTYHPSLGSPAIATGDDLTSLLIPTLNFDRNGNARPSGSNWTAGALNSGDILFPAAPTGVTLQ